MENTLDSQRLENELGYSLASGFERPQSIGMVAKVQLDGPE